jgi:hypothetical protein
MTSHYLRNAAKVLGWALAATLTAALNGWIVVSNYMACLQSFQLLGFESKPLKDDELFGWFFSTIAPEATLAHLYAGAVAGAVAMGLWIEAHLLFRVYAMLQDRSEYRHLGDAESERIASRRILFALGLLAVVAVPLVFAIIADVQYFRFRMVAQALGIEDPQKAAGTIENWDLQMTKNGRLFAWSIARFGAWAYIAVIGVACLGLEFFAQQNGEAVARLFAPVEQAQPEFYGYDENGQPVYSRQTPVAYDRDGNPVLAESEPQPFADGTGGGSRPGEPEPGGPAPEPEQPVTTAAQNGDAGVPQEIIGAQGARVTVEEALAAPARYWVDPETHDIWDASYHRDLVGNARPPEPEAAAA